MMTFRGKQSMIDLKLEQEIRERTEKSITSIFERDDIDLVAILKYVVRSITIIDVLIENGKSDMESIGEYMAYFDCNENNYEKQ